MRDALAERLLAAVMEWTPEDVARERPTLQTMASYKYDEYQQFSPGMRFVESLALWLSQFITCEERQIAYNFIRERLIFYSSAEMNHLISITYPDYIRPILLSRAAQLMQIPEKYIMRIAGSMEYRKIRRQSIYLGLSDGAQIDVFRRCNQELSHEQISQVYDISPDKAQDMLNNLSNDLERIIGGSASGCLFREVFLLDDFSASGISYLREDSAGIYSGKIGNFYKGLLDSTSGISKLVHIDDLSIHVVLYMTTQRAKSYLENMLTEMLRGRNIHSSISVVQLLKNDISVARPTDSKFLDLIDYYYDPDVEDIHTRKGGSDVKLGFASCGLPLVLSHNTPNNSVFLLWANPDTCSIRGLFPRISRHRDDL